MAVDGYDKVRETGEDVRASFVRGIEQVNAVRESPLLYNMLLHLIDRMEGLQGTLERIDSRLEKMQERGVKTY